MTTQMRNVAIHRFAAFTALCTLCLIGVGGLVTSHGVGMSVPDWPNTYGYNMFFFPVSQWAGGIFYEHTHRLVASAVGLLTVILALWLHGRNSRPLMRWGGVFLVVAGIVLLILKPQRVQDVIVIAATGLVALGTSFVFANCDPAPRWLRRLGVVAVVAVIVQGILGGLRVIQIKDELGIFHAVLAQLFFLLLCAITLFTSAWWNRLPEPSRPLGGTALALTTLILLQLALGATMRHQHAGLAIPDFPAAYGRLYPDTSPAAVELYNQRRLEVMAVKPITSAQIHLQMTHRLLGVLIFGGALYYGFKVTRIHTRKNFYSFSAYLWLGEVMAQVILGASVIWTNKAADIATAHVLLGVLTLATGTIVCIVALHKQNDESQRHFAKSKPEPSLR